MEQGNVKRLQIKSLIDFTITSSFSFYCDLSGYITQQMVKAISIFLSQDGIVLEELNLSLKKRRRNISFHHQTGDNKIGDEGCVHLVEGLKKNKTIKKLSLGGIFSFKTAKFTIFKYVVSLLKE